MGEDRAKAVCIARARGKLLSGRAIGLFGCFDIFFIDFLSILLDYKCADYNKIGAFYKMNPTLLSYIGHM